MNNFGKIVDSYQERKKYKKKRAKITSAYTGVYRSPSDTWRAFVNTKKKQIFLGNFNTEIDAARARDCYIIKNHLSKSLSFPDFNYDNYETNKNPRKSF